MCLPCEHQGGQLVVRHQGQVQTFDWSGSSKDIKWAAFYSDCEHEVLEVTSGHRITLTYNLYMRHSLGDTRRNRAFDLEQLPAYQLVKEALAKPDFMPNGKYVASDVMYNAQYVQAAHSASTVVMHTLMPPRMLLQLFPPS